MQSIRGSELELALIASKLSGSACRYGPRPFQFRIAQDFLSSGLGNAHQCTSIGGALANNVGVPLQIEADLQGHGPSGPADLG
jgi:hypothetical protein